MSKQNTFKHRSSPIQISKNQQEDIKKSSQLSPTEKLAPFSKLYKYLTKSQKCILAIGAINAALTGIAFPTFAILFGGVIQQVGPNYPLKQMGQDIKRVSIFFFYIAIGLTLFGFLNFGLWMMIGERIGLHLRQKYLEAVLNQDVEWFDTTNPIEIPSKINQQSSTVARGTGEKVANVITSVMTFVTGIIVSLTLGWQLTLALVASSPLIVVSSFILTKLTSKGLQDNSKAYATAGGIADQALVAIKTVASFTAEERQIQKYCSYLEKSQKIGKKIACCSGIGLGFFWLSIFILFSFCVYLGGVFVDQQFKTKGLFGDRYDSATVITILFSILFGLFALGTAGPNFVSIIQARMAGKLIFEVIQRKPRIDYSIVLNQIDVRELNPVIEFKDVQFSYPSRPETTILQNFNFLFESGKTTAIVGSTGSGKSTIVQLIERFYDPNQGSIQIGGIQLSHLDIHQLRRDVISYVGQEPALFDMTIRENIKFGKPEASDQQVIDACKASNAWEFIEKMQKGLDTLVGASGSQISGGQKQRIAIARAIIKKPKILLLDQATSALDRKNEAYVQEALQNISKDITTIIIAHRLTTIEHVDTIIVLDKGEAIEVGNHEKLLSIKGVYANLVSGQMNQSPEEEEEQGSENIQDSGQSFKIAFYQDKKVEDCQNVHVYDDDSQQLMNQVSKRSDRLSLLGKSNPQQQNTLQKQQQQIAKQQQAKLLEEVKKQEQEQQTKIKEIIKQNEKTVTTRLLKISCKNKTTFFFGLIFSLLLGIMFPMLAFITANSTTALSLLDFQRQNKISDKHGKDDVDRLAMWFIVVAVISFITQWLVQLLFGNIAENVTVQIRRDTFTSLLRKHIGWYDSEDHSQPNVSSTLSSDTALLNSVSSHGISVMIQSLNSLFIGVLMGFIFSWRLALIIVVLSLMILGGYFEAKLQSGFGSNIDEAYQSSSGIVSESVLNFRTVSSFSNQGLIQKHYHKSLELPFKKGVKKAMISGFIYGISQGAQYICYGFAFFFAGILVSEDLLEYQNMFKAIFAVMFSAFGAGQAQSFAPDIGRAKLQALMSIKYSMSQVKQIQ